MVVPVAAAEAPREVVADPTGQASAQALAASVLFGAPASAVGAVEHLVSTREDLAARRAVIPALPADASPTMRAIYRDVVAVIDAGTVPTDLFYTTQNGVQNRVLIGPGRLAPLSSRDALRSLEPLDRRGHEPACHRVLPSGRREMEGRARVARRDGVARRRATRPRRRWPRPAGDLAACGWAPRRGLGRVARSPAPSTRR